MEGFLDWKKNDVDIMHFIWILRPGSNSHNAGTRPESHGFAGGYLLFRPVSAESAEIEEVYCPISAFGDNISR